MARHDHFVLASINRKKVVWWFDVPMARVHSKEITLDLLLFDHRKSVVHHFRVPFSFITENLKRFDVRNHKVRIELGANPVSPLRRSASRRAQGARVLLSGPVLRHGLRPVDRAERLTADR